MGRNVATITSWCTGHGCFPSRQTPGGSSNVFANNLGVHREGDYWNPHCCDSCHPGWLAKGSSTVYCNGKQVGRIGDPIDCGSKVKTGRPGIYVGD